MKSLEELNHDITTFRDKRNWKQFHTPKNLAISISIEAAELLEIFQWTEADMNLDTKRERIEEELADVLIYCGLMADVMGMNVDEIITRKLQINEMKYPIEKSYGKSDKYTELE